MKEFYANVMGRCPDCDSVFDGKTKVVGDYDPTDLLAYSFFIDCDTCEESLELVVSYEHLLSAGVEVSVTPRPNPLTAV